jgi:hypothetical protein
VEAWLIHWPAYGELEWISESAWPKFAGFGSVNDIGG